MDDAIDDSVLGKNDYEKGIRFNQQELRKDMYPCEIQKKRFDAYGSYRGEIIVEENEEKYHERFGYYPERILADKIYLFFFKITEKN